MRIELTQPVDFYTVETTAGSKGKRGGAYVTLPAGTVAILPLPHLLNDHTGAQVQTTKNTIPLESIIFPGQFVEITE